VNQNSNNLKVLAERDERYRFRVPSRWLAIGASGTAVALLVAVLVARYQIGHFADQLSPVDDAEILLSLDDLAFYEHEPDFYDWAANESI